MPMLDSFAPGYDRTSEGWVIFPRDTELRHRLFPFTDPAEHIAKANMLMVEELVNYVSEYGETIYDPFAGTGTILVGAPLGRKILMSELVDTFVQTIELNTIGIQQTYPDVKELISLIPGNAANILPIPGVCDHMIFCLHPGTRVLTKNLQWLCIGSLSAGDVLVGVDEFARPGEKLRKLRYSRILKTKPAKLESYKIFLTDGREIIASSNHAWLTARNHSQQWTETVDLRRGDKIKQLTSRTWETRISYDAGYLAGMLDREGSLEGFVEASQGSRTLHGYRVSFSQKEGLVFDNTWAAWMNLGCQGTVDKPNKQRIQKLRTTRLEDSLFVLGSIRPLRLLSNLDLNGVGLPMVDSHAEIKEIFYVGIQDSIGIETSTRTLIAEGLVSHNSPPYPMGLKKKGNMDKTSVDLGYSQATEYSEGVDNFTNMNPFIYHQKIEQFYKKCFESIKMGGTLTVIIKDKVEKGKRVMQADRTLRDCEKIGFKLIARNKWYARGGGYSAINRAAGLETVDDEDLITMRRP